jgi:4-hydroxythreonine-4-phosphate dehydrogenase
LADEPRPIGVTLGDPAGIGPEVLAKALDGSLPDSPLTLIGGQWALERGAAAAGVALPPLERVDTPAQQRSVLGLVDLGAEAPDFRFGRVDAACGALAAGAVERATGWCLDGQLAAMVTCPINKEAIHAAGYVDDIGHQEILARLTGATSTATVLMTPQLKVVHLSTHKSLIEAARFVTCENVLEKLRLTHVTFGAWGLPEPRIAVAALNPHGGEGGLLGVEEIEQLTPAVAAAREEGIEAVGPIPADSIFNRAIAGEFDVVLALYHDQGHIAIKVHDFHASTTATLGIPFIRTSVDHGTAFDIAGRGTADERGMVAALRAARALVSGQLARL